MRALSWMCGLLSLAVVGCGADDGGRGAPGPALVRVAEARDGGLTDTWTTVGEAVALEQSELAVGAEGPVARVTVREGDRVDRGALLLQVDAAIALADHAAAQAAHDEAASELVRLEAALERRAQREKEKAEKAVDWGRRKGGEREEAEECRGMQSLVFCFCRCVFAFAPFPFTFHFSTDVLRSSPLSNAPGICSGIQHQQRANANTNRGFSPIWKIRYEKNEIISSLFLFIHSCPYS